MPEPRFTIDVIAGDGIGQEVVPAARRCVDAAVAAAGVTLTWRERDWGSDHYRRTGRMMPVDALETMASADAIMLGAVGEPGIPDDVTLWGLLIPIRRTFDQYVNLRPVRLLPGTTSPLRGIDELDLVIVRENVEGEYSSVGGRFDRAGGDTVAVQESLFSRSGTARVARYAAQLAASRRGTLVSATKSNGIIHTMPFWDEVVAQTVAETAPKVALRSVLIDALAAELVLHPHASDVIVASNLFGDILSDLAAALAGSIGVAPSASLNPERAHPSLFEPVHGSAPDIAGRGIANPVAQIWSASMMLSHLGLDRPAAALYDAMVRTMARGILTGDLGGDASTDLFADAVVGDLDGREHG
ncbi:isocitrate/isopropylmalate family dehydrogenase [Microbacterium sp. SSW1-59]|uniref:isocitrate/isopropylmalate dehydrogenase family protein n=1 Tax=Microbacterium xanthum TaxID=3079794 RepID=UPI002AD50547|nr:isocitrate/isopropylmalate family dehydrogenase [Microbacterium sp. SSW1-59]MDZ8200898.1 isocitrate/isopropylmalate family dehydrogenase [Microbacterium sp. SSW1-59]